MNLLEHRILEEYSKIPTEHFYSKGNTDRLYLIEEPDFLQEMYLDECECDIQEKTKIKMYILKTITNQFITDEYLSPVGQITSLGQTELHLFWKNWFLKVIESLCKIYLPLIISIAAIIISLIALKKP